MYELVSEVFGHQGDIRSLCSLGGSQFASGSRDRLGKVWTENGGAVSETQTLYDHEHWVSALVHLPQGGFVTGSQDNKMRWYDKSFALVSTIVGHTGPVSSLAWNEKTQELVSGSWDGTARTWFLDAQNRTYSCTSTLAGHENGACVLALPNGDIVTGSAGVQVGNRIEGFQLRVWRGGQVIKTMKSHMGAIRSLCLTARDGSTFASTSNDGTVKVWSSESFDELVSMPNPPGPEGSPAFNFCVASLGDYGQVGVACDDCCVRVWGLSDGALLQEIPHPCTVWCLDRLDNGDIVTGGSDGFLRIFSEQQARKAPQEIRDAYLEQTNRTREAIAKKASNGGNKIDATKLPKFYEAPPGTTDGDVRMFNKNGEAWVYQWSEVSGTWVEVGEVMGDAEGGKEELDGEFYDKVIPVEVEDPATGGLRKLKLGFNNGDNPYMIAQMFVQKHELDESNTQDIVDFIQRMRGSSNSTPMIDMSAGFGATAESKTQQEVTPMEVEEPLTDRLYPLPSCTGMAFEAVDLDKVLDKLLEFNAETGSATALTEKELNAIREAVVVLKNTSRYHATEIDPASLRALEKALQWPDDRVFPAMDLIRVMLTHPDGSRVIRSQNGKAILERSLQIACKDGAPLAVALIGARLAANFFRHAPGAEMITDIVVGPGAQAKFLQPLQELAGYPNKNVRSAVATCFLNCANALYHLARTDVTRAVGKSLLEASIRLGSDCVGQGAKEAESVRRCLLAVGCLICIPACKEDAAQVMGLVDRSEALGSDPVSQVCTRLRRTIQKVHK